MRVKIDENLPAALADLLALHGHEAETVAQEGLQGRDDRRIWEECQSARRFLITQDLDFSDVRAFRPGTHCGILLLRLAVPGRAAILRRLRLLLDTYDIAAWSGCFVVVSDRKVRIIRPGPAPRQEGA